MSQPIQATLLDTDILSAVMRQHPAALLRARTYLAVFCAPSDMGSRGRRLIGTHLPSSARL